MADIANLVEELSKLTVIEAADLVKQLETKWGVSAAAPVAVAAAGGAVAAAAPAEVKDTFDVILVSVPADKKIAAIKAVREVKAGRIDFKLDKNGNVSGSIGKVTFESEQLFENARAFIDGVVRAKPPAAKGNFIRSVTLAASMLPGLPLEASTYTKATA